MITHRREWRPETRQGWWDALEEGDQWAKAMAGSCLVRGVTYPSSMAKATGLLVT